MFVLAMLELLYVAETPRGIELSPYNTEFEKDMELLEDMISKNRTMFKKLAE